MDYSFIPVRSFSEDYTYTEKRIQEISHQEHYKIYVNYPYTPYAVLNQELDRMIGTIVTSFKKDIQGEFIPNIQYYSLMIQYEAYSYQNYISYVFYIFEDLGGAHPNTMIATISYDKVQEKLVTIDTLVAENPSILEIFSAESVTQIKNSGKFLPNEYENISDMILEGTRPTRHNFRNFAFSDIGMILFFENYQVAPYSYGSFQAVIPYNLL